MKYLSNKKGFLGIDNKFSIKENVVVGRLIPAGTGLAKTRQTEDVEDEEMDSIDLETALSEALSSEED